MLFSLRMGTIAGFCTAALSLDAQASCGLRECPAVQQVPAATAVRASAAARHTEFDLEGVQGNYSSYVSRLELTRNGWILGATATIVTLRRSGETHTGAGNPLLFAQRRVLTRSEHRLHVGLQYEVPWGETRDGIASDHHELLPYARWALSAGRAGAELTLGYRFSIGESGGGATGSPSLAPIARGSGIALHAGHDHATAVDYVDPHAEREVVWRAAVTGPGTRLAPALGVEGRHVVSAGEDLLLLTADLRVSVPLARRFSVEAMGTVPLTDARRYDWNTELGLRLY
jgi:hypothetical protein